MGIDFDNTLIDYDGVFVVAARRHGLVDLIRSRHGPDKRASINSTAGATGFAPKCWRVLKPEATLTAA